MPTKRRIAVIFYIFTFAVVLLYVATINPSLNIINLFNRQGGKNLFIHPVIAENDIWSWLWTKQACDNRLILEGKSYFNKMQFAESIKIFEQALADKTINDGRVTAFTYIGLGNSYLQTYLRTPRSDAVNNNGFLLKAKTNLENALKLLKHPDILNVSVYSSLGSAYYELGDNNKAIAYLRRAMEYSSVGCTKEFIDIYTNLGLIYLRLENFDKAGYYLNKALQICPKNYAAFKHIYGGLSNRGLLLDYYLRKKIAVHLITATALFFLIYNFFIINLIKNKPKGTRGYLNKDELCV